MNRGPAEMAWYLWILVAVILLGQGTWLFLDARRLGARPWLWGLLGLIQCPMPLVAYWLFVRRPRARQLTAAAVQK